VIETQTQLDFKKIFPFLKYYISNLIVYYKIGFNIPPTIKVATIIISADFIISFIPSSFTKIAKVATQGKYILRTENF